MLYEQKLSGAVILWPGGKPKDKPAPPAEPRILELLARCECTVIMGLNCYEIVNKHGDALELPFDGASFDEWVTAVEQVANHVAVDKT